MFRFTLCVALVAVLTPIQARAQTGDQLAGLLLDLITRSSATKTDARPATPIVHEPHFIPGIALKLTPREMNKAIATQLTTFPLPSSSGGFAYTTDPATGEVRLTTQTFGPVFAERALTIGRKRFDFGMAFQSVSFDSFEGAELTDGSIKFALEHNNCCPGGSNAPTLPTGEGPNPFNPAFERDLLQSQISLDVETNTTVFFANYGLTDRVDIGAAIPIVSVRLGGSVTSSIVRTATAADPALHSFDGLGQTSLTASAIRSATGLGDVLLRAKYNFVLQDASALAAAVDLRLPTGDKDDLLGTGATQAKFQLIASGEYGRVAPHASFGYTFSSGDVSDLTSEVQVDPTLPGAPSITSLATPAFDASMPDEVNYSFGVSAAPHPRVTIGFDFVGRTIRDVLRFDIGDQTFPSRGPDNARVDYVATNNFLVRGDQQRGTPQNLHLALGVVGGKVNIGRGLLINTGVLFPLSKNGLQPKVTAFVGLDYVF